MVTLCGDKWWQNGDIVVTFYQNRTYPCAIGWHFQAQGEPTISKISVRNPFNLIRSCCTFLVSRRSSGLSDQLPYLGQKAKFSRTNQNYFCRAWITVRKICFFRVAERETCQITWSFQLHGTISWRTTRSYDWYLDHRWLCCRWRSVSFMIHHDKAHHATDYYYLPDFLLTTLDTILELPLPGERLRRWGHLALPPLELRNVCCYNFCN